MKGQKNAARWLGKELRKLGARGERDRNGTSYWFPDGAQRFVEERIQFPAALDLLRSLQARYGRPDRALRAPKVVGAPTVDLARTSATQHAQERLRLMQTQAAVTFLEMTMALTCPVRTRWSDEHASWIWEGDRIAVAAQQSDDGHTRITTILWTRPEMWAAHPRPEQTKART
ncbi:MULTISPECIES: hypothetical protein [unclassified Microbacterium]|uniref:hypothetical protein n=1 Tax=unclassified Microbacterium TaxID=2609290 RepID=UPI00386C6639